MFASIRTLRLLLLRINCIQPLFAIFIDIYELFDKQTERYFLKISYLLHQNAWLVFSFSEIKKIYMFVINVSIIGVTNRVSNDWYTIDSHQNISELKERSLRAKDLTCVQIFSNLT